MRTLLFATTNPHKVEEANAALARCGYRVEPYQVPLKLEVQADDLATIAAYAALNAYLAARRPVVAEDAGLFIEALNGFPGPYSSYVYRTIGVRGVLKLMEGVEDRRARFESAVALAYSGGVVVFRGVVWGRIADRPRGSGGFGFDPIFVPEGEERTFAEMSVEEKTRLSHRGRAFSKLCEWLERAGELA